MAVDASGRPGSGGDAGKGGLIPLDLDRGDAVAADLGGQRFATLPGLLDAARCAAIAALYDADAPFRSHIQMTRYGCRRAEHKYFATMRHDL